LDILIMLSLRDFIYFVLSYFYNHFILATASRRGDLRDYKEVYQYKTDLIIHSNY